METVDIRTARPGPIKHKELPEAMLERSRFILSKLDGLAGDFNQFVDGLKRDTNPDRELRVWTYIALAYTAFFGASSSLKTPDKQRAAFAVLLAFSTGRDAAQLTDLGLSPSQVAWLTQTYLAFADAAAD